MEEAVVITRSEDHKEIIIKSGFIENGVFKTVIKKFANVDDIVCCNFRETDLQGIRGYMITFLKERRNGKA
jgi:hypothetical protein